MKHLLMIDMGPALWLKVQPRYVTGSFYWENGDFTPCHVAGQVEQKRLNISSNVPVAVQQWEGLIAINYPARAAGITRHMRVHEAKALCPELQCVHVETIGASLCSTSLSDPDYILGRLMSNETSALPMYNASSAPNNT